MSERSRAHNAHWLAWLTRGDRQARPQGDAERGELRADPLSGEQRPHRRRRRRLPHQARADPAPGRAGYGRCRTRCGMTVGTEEANRLVVERALEDFHGRASSGREQADAALFNRLALIGVGLIGSSIARAAKAQGAVRLDRRHRALAADAPARRRARHRRSGGRDQRRGGRRRRSRHRLHSGRRLRRGRQGDRRASRARRDRLRRRLGQGLGGARHGARICRRPCISCPAHPVAGTEYSGPGRGLCRTVRQPLVHPDAAARRRSGGDRKARRVLAPARRQCRDAWRPITTTWCSPSPAICRI